MISPKRVFPWRREIYRGLLARGVVWKLATAVVVVIVDDGLLFGAFRQLIVTDLFRWEKVRKQIAQYGMSRFLSIPKC